MPSYTSLTSPNVELAAFSQSMFIGGGKRNALAWVHEIKVSAKVRITKRKFGDFSFELSNLLVGCKKAPVIDFNISNTLLPLVGVISPKAKT